jgi:hypothetical protein
MGPGNFGSHLFQRSDEAMIFIGIATFLIYALLLIAALAYYGVARGRRALLRLGRNAVLIVAAALSLAVVLSSLERLSR